MCVFGEMMHLAEGSVQPNTLGTMPGAMYWALTTLTTVGYGDVTPVTPLGKLLAMVTMVTGLALFALPVGIIANGFVTGLSRRRFAITWRMLRRQPLFRDFGIDVLNAILEVPTASIIREQAHVVVRGRDAAELYLVVSGRAYIEGDNGTDTAIVPGDTIGAEAFSSGATYRDTITAEREMRVLAFPGDDLRRLCRKYPVLRNRMESLLSPDGSGRADPHMRIAALEAENAKLRNALVDLVLERHAATRPQRA
jgi:voltage-gated potassium channel